MRALWACISDLLDRMIAIGSASADEIGISARSEGINKVSGKFMPHLVMEYSNSVEERVNIQRLLEDLHHVAIQSGVFDAPSLKSRAHRYHDWLIGELADSVDFIHVTFELLDGRSAEQKRELSRMLMQVLQEQASHVHSLTINIRDMDRECFQKVVN